MSENEVLTVVQAAELLGTPPAEFSRILSQQGATEVEFVTIRAVLAGVLQRDELHMLSEDTSRAIACTAADEAKEGGSRVLVVGWIPPDNSPRVAWLSELDPDTLSKAKRTVLAIPVEAVFTRLAARARALQGTSARLN